MSPLTTYAVHGDHEFMMPNFTAGDVRGPCPGLNTLANHNYLPRNGVATVRSFLESLEPFADEPQDSAIHGCY